MSASSPPPPPYKPKGIVYPDIPPLPPGWVRVEDHREKWEKLRIEAREEAKHLAHYLAEKWNVSRVWIYGSAAGRIGFSEWSDIDLAVEGLPATDHCRAWSDVEKACGLKLAVDLQRREEWKDEAWARLSPKPMLLYERLSPPPAAPRPTRPSS